MASGGQKRTRSERVAALEIRPGKWERAWANLRRRDVLLRLSLTLLTAVGLCLVIQGWRPPFSYRIGYVPPRDITARVPFSLPDAATDIARVRPDAGPLRLQPGRRNRPSSFARSHCFGGDAGGGLCGRETGDLAEFRLHPTPAAISPGVGDAIAVRVKACKGTRTRRALRRLPGDGNGPV